MTCAGASVGAAAASGAICAGETVSAVTLAAAVGADSHAGVVADCSAIFAAEILLAREEAWMDVEWNNVGGFGSDEGECEEEG